MNKCIKKVSYIIGYRQSNQERLKALVFVLSLLRKYFPNLEIIVVEQDSKPKLELNSSLKIRQFFIKKRGLYNCCQGFNFAASQTDKEFLVFSCSDVFLAKADYLELFQAGANFEAVTPHKTELLNISVTNRTDHEFKILGKRKLYTFAGGIVLMTRSGFEKTGGWDERFEGWGGDDDVMSHVIYNKLVSKTFRMPFYHIDHPRTVFDGKEQPSYKENRQLMEEVQTMNGAALDRYIRFVRNKKQHILPETPKFVLAVTTFNRFEYFEKMITSFFKTRNTKADWKIIIADDNSSEETQNYLSFLQKEHDAIILKNKHVGINRQINTIFRKLSRMDFDLCFKCDDDILFKAAGWDDLYWNTIRRNGYDHLVFYDKSWQSHFNLKTPTQKGGLVANCKAEYIQGSFFTITKSVLEEIGYFDEQLLGQYRLAHLDYSLRCARAGYNASAHPFDVVGSNFLLRIQSESYSLSTALTYRNMNTLTPNSWYKEKLQADRQYIPYNENFESITRSNKDKLNRQLAVHGKADATFYSGTGIAGLGIKLLYNFGLKIGVNFIPLKIKKIGVLLKRLGTSLINIDN